MRIVRRLIVINSVQSCRINKSSCFSLSSALLYLRSASACSHLICSARSHTLSLGGSCSQVIVSLRRKLVATTRPQRLSVCASVLLSHQRAGNNIIIIILKLLVIMVIVKQQIMVTIIVIVVLPLPLLLVVTSCWLIIQDLWQ